jgi:CubicO group peptidase (beta-lactamase class C family)
MAGTGVEVNGHVKPGFEAVRDAFAANWADGESELGASVAVIHKGEMVVDIWGGHADPERIAPWERDTIVNVWSTTKTMMFLVILELVDKGALKLTDPVAKFWPEFAANGKEGIEIRHIMSHTAGLSGWEQPMTLDDFADFDKCASGLAAQAPWWEPGSVSGYHAITQGYLIGEVVKRVTGVTLGNYFRTTFAEPLGADFHIGTPAECDSRVSLNVPPPPLQIDGVAPDSISMRTFVNPIMDARVTWTLPWRRCESAAANGHGNARSVATVQSLISHRGEHGGKRYFSSGAVDAIFDVQAEGVDLVLNQPVKFGVGYGLNSEYSPVSPNPRACWWAGWGGSLVVNDLDAELTYAYAMNKMAVQLVGDMRAAGPLMATYGVIA